MGMVPEATAMRRNLSDRTGRYIKAREGTQVERGLFDVGFGEGGHGWFYASMRRSPFGSGTGSPNSLAVSIHRVTA